MSLPNASDQATDVTVSFQSILFSPWTTPFREQAVLSFQTPGKNNSPDEPQIVSVPGQGTTVSTKQWKSNTTSAISLP